jgi:ribosome-binding ATPase YchF (GTP1/OBG family)
MEEQAQRENTQAVVVSAKIESEVANLPQEEQKEYLTLMGLSEPGLNRIVRTAYSLLGLITYFTVGPKEARAWTIIKGTKAPQAAGVIHSDFEKGFIRAEIISYADYIGCSGEVGARSSGKMRLEGKEYTINDGDVMHVRSAL